MSDFGELVREEITRRDFMHAAAALTGFCLLDCEATAQQANVPFSNALADARVVQEAVTFKSGADTIDGYLARPRAKGKYPIVLVIAGNKIAEEYIRNTTALLAQAGFVGLAPNIFALQLDTMSAEEKRQVFSDQITDERIFRDLQAGIDFLQPQPFVKRGKVGLTGFCFGGRCALMFAAQSKAVGAVVPFYGNLKTPAFAKRAVDPLDLIKQMKAPIQGHYALNDAEIPLAQLRNFEQQVRAQGTPVEMFTYEAAHGFFAYTRASYQAAAAQLAWERARQFLQKHLR
ncbi:MAG: dienelactone hydrolase family protein [Blastocatellia bacterium]